MALIKLSGGPLDGQEREIDNPDMMATEYPGYAAVEQVMDPDKGQLLKTEWHGGDAEEAYYDRERTDGKVSDRERERYGNETGVREPGAQDKARQRTTAQGEDPNQGEPVNRTGGNETTGAQKRDAKNDTADAKRKGAEGRQGKQKQ